MGKQGARRVRDAIAAFAVFVAALLALATAAEAAFPGQNGLIAFSANTPPSYSAFI